jgi:hypothetical protein
MNEAIAAWIESVAPWSSAPSWARYRAMDGDFHVFWYQCRPYYDSQMDNWTIPIGTGRVKAAYIPDHTPSEFGFSERPE